MFHSISLLLIFLNISCGILPTSTDIFDAEQGWNKVDSILNLIKEPIIPENEFYLTEFGGNGDGISDNKMAFDSIINVCSKNGGGKIIVTPGNYLINGPIHLKSNINLHLQEGSKLSFSSNPKDYLPVVLTSWEGTRLYNYSPFIYTFKQKNIAITGKGEIDGEASETWATWKKNQNEDKLLTRKMNNDNVPVEERIFGEGHLLRPHLIQFYECENILVDGIKITDSPFWCLHLLFSKNIIVRNVIYDAQNVNNDGIDPESSENVLIENIKFNNHDDNIAIKAGRDLEARTLNRPSKNIIIRNCKFGGYNAFAVGSEMSGGVNNVFVEDCTFDGNVIYGIYLKGNLDRGGEVSNIFVRNIEFDATESAIMIDSYYKEEGSCCPPAFKNIFIENVTCNSTRDYAISLIGSKKQPLNNIHIKNVTIKNATKTKTIKNVENLVMEKISINGKDHSGTY
jgi:polygalacturonase